MNVGIGTVPAQFVLWEYLFRIFCIVYLHCGIGSGGGSVLRQNREGLAMNQHVVLVVGGGGVPECIKGSL
jgi:hypothetical protein